MPTDIKLKNSVTATNAPTSLQQGEVAINITDKKVWVGNAATTPVQLLGTGADGSFTNLAYTGTLTGGTGIVNLGSGQFYKDASGNIGVGTTSPSASITVLKQTTVLSGTGNGYGMYIYPTGTGATYIDALNNSTSNSSIALRTYNNGTYTQAIHSNAGNTTTFETAGSERMRITSAGLVGIGTSSPAWPLDIASATGVTRVVSTTGTNAVYSYLTNTGGDFYIGRDNSAGSAFSSGTAYSSVLYSSGAYPMVLYTNAIERMRITSGGLVGINAASPTNTLQVAGGISTTAASPAFQASAAIIDVSGGAARFNATGADNSTQGTFLFNTSSANAGVFNERLRITPAGSMPCTAATTRGPYFRAGNTNSVANNGTISITSATAGGALVCVYDPGSGLGGVFWVNYSSTVTKIAGDGEATDTGSSFAVYKSSNSHTATLKNRNGATTTYTIAVYSAFANND
jgi:hypothetical protein